MPEAEQIPTPQLNSVQPIELAPPKKRSIKKIIMWAICALAAVIIGSAVSGIIWYKIQLTPVGNDISQLTKITIALGSTPDQIGDELKEQSIIRNSTAFDVYMRIFGRNKILQAGTYRLSPAETVPQIVEHLANGSVDQFSITFFPGATLKDTTDTPRSKKYDVTTVLENAGYSDQEIEAGLNAIYSSPLFDSKPPSADLEGYVYGETYNFNTGATVEDILKGTFEEFYKVVQDNNLVKDFLGNGLNLYEGIILASIVQREINSPQGTNQPTQDQEQAAQVFYSRLAIGMPLGSDVTSIYIAHKTGQETEDYGLVSPYNTRISVGLPPSPIAVPGITALRAVAQPAKSTYWYFLSDPEGKIYFAYTNAQHEANIVNYCKEACK